MFNGSFPHEVEQRDPSVTCDANGKDVPCIFPLLRRQVAIYTTAKPAASALPRSNFLCVQFYGVSMNYGIPVSILSGIS
jgi:hypothetical protein